MGVIESQFRLGSSGNLHYMQIFLDMMRNNLKNTKLREKLEILHNPGAKLARRESYYWGISSHRLTDHVCIHVEEATDKSKIVTDGGSFSDPT